MIDPYADREQTRAKHFILRRYLQALAFKILTFADIVYVDGFSGPWRTKTEDFGDSSFMIALSVLRDAQTRILGRTKVRRRIRCFFSESDPDVFLRLQEAVAPFHKPNEKFEIKTYCGKFEDAVDEIQAFIGVSFPLIFIDPTGWSGYPFDKIRRLFLRPKCEVLINFMYEFVNRFSHSDEMNIVDSLNPILGGPGWRSRLDPDLPRGSAVEKLFRETLKAAGNFEFVVSTKIDKETADRPHFFITYGTKSVAGLKEFRKIEYDALREHGKNRANAKERTREQRSHTADLFAGYQAAVQAASVNQIVREHKELASRELIAVLQQGDLTFSGVVARLLQSHMLRETNVKDICVDLALAGMVENTWGGEKRKPSDGCLIKLRRTDSEGHRLSPQE